MTFKQAVERTAEIRNAFQPGLGALRRMDRAHITADNPRLLKGSVDLDKALHTKYPNANRWDYGIGQKPANSNQERVFWVEVHPNRAGEVEVVLAKLEWLKHWLRDCAKNLDKLQREFIWVSSGATTFTLTAPKQKQLALLGLQRKGGHFTIPNEAKP